MDFILLKSNRKLGGYTLIELVIVIAIFLFIIAAAIGIFLSIIVHQKRVLAEQQLLYQVSYAEEYVSKALRMAAVDTGGSCLGTDAKDFIYLLTDCDLSSGLCKGIKFLNQSDPDETGAPACQEIYFEKEDPNCTDESSPDCQLVLKELKNSINNSDAVNLTSTDLKINFGKFIINGDLTHIGCSNPNLCGVKRCATEFCTQPRVTIIFDVQLPGENQVAKRFQTTVSQRNLNAP